jgi:hypothetical protein
MRGKMRRLLGPIGERPRGFFRVVGFVCAAILYSGAVTTAATLLLALALVWLAEMAAGTPWALPVGFVWLVASSAFVTYLLLASRRRYPRLTWAVWWVLLVDSLLRFVAAILAVAGAPQDYYRYGLWSLFAYDFGQARWSTALACVVVGATTIAILVSTSRQACEARQTVE